MKTVTLSRKYTVHGKTFDTVELREPTYKDVFMAGLGMPFEWQLSPNGSPMRVSYPLVVDAYIVRLATNPSAECLGELVAVDALKLEAALVGFFMELATTSPTQPTSSSSEPDSMPQPSAT